MTYQPMTPFRRAADLVQIRRTAALRAANAGADPVDKWEALRVLRLARPRIGVTDRQLTVLQALLSFVPTAELQPGEASCIVHPSNVTICDRLNGMPCSTMRRHVAALVDLGLITRRDSPNGKRYVRRRPGEREVFGLDLSPIAVRIDEFRAAAEAERDAELHRAGLRRDASSMLRDLLALLDCGSATSRSEMPEHEVRDLVGSASRALRRKLTAPAIEALTRTLHDALRRLSTSLAIGPSAEMSIRDLQDEHHSQKSNEDTLDTYRRPTAMTPARKDLSETGDLPTLPRKTQPELPSLPDLIEACPDARAHASTPIRSWDEVIRVAEHTRGMIGISAAAWSRCCMVMGRPIAAATILMLLQRFETLRSPSGYLRKLIDEAEAGRYSCDRLMWTLGSMRARGSHL